MLLHNFAVVVLVVLGVTIEARVVTQAVPQTERQKYGDPECISGKYKCPDMRAAIRDIRLGRFAWHRDATESLPERNGIFWINATTLIGNMGDGPMEVHPVTNGDSVTAFQWIHPVSSFDPILKHEVGIIALHPTHLHWHVNGVVMLHLMPAVDNDASKGPDWDANVEDSIKITFCIIDLENLRHPLYDGPYDPLFASCKTAEEPQGLKSGYSDVYPWFIPGQGMPIDPIQHPSGIYFLVEELNYNLNYKETQRSSSNHLEHNNNLAWVALNLTWSEEGKPSIVEDKQHRSASFYDLVGNTIAGLEVDHTPTLDNVAFGCGIDCPRGCCVEELSVDIDRSGVVGVSDLGHLLSSWGGTYSNADVDGDLLVGVKDLALVLLRWNQQYDPRFPTPMPTSAPTTPSPTVNPDDLCCCLSRMARPTDQCNYILKTDCTSATHRCWAIAPNMRRSQDERQR